MSEILNPFFKYKGVRVFFFSIISINLEYETTAVAVASVIILIPKTEFVGFPGTHSRRLYC